MKRNIWIGIGIIVVVALAIVLIVTQTKKKVEEIKIGVISSLTGTIAPYGQSVWEGIQIAVNEINENGGIGAKSIKVLLEDAQSDPKVSVSAVNKLINVDKVPVIIGPVASSNVMAVAPIVNEKATVILSPAAASPRITEAGDYVFRNRAAGGLEALKLAEYAYKRLRVKKACLLYINTDYGVAYKDIIKKRFIELGGGILLVESFNQGDTDFRSQITKLLRFKPKAIFLLGNPKEVGQILKQSKEIGLQATFLANNVESDELLKAASDAAEGLIFVLPFFEHDNSAPKVKNFVEKYKERFGRIPDLYAANGYDAVYLVKIAIERGGYKGEGIKRALYEIKNYSGVNGIISFDKHGDVIKPLAFKTIKDGRYQVLRP